MLRRSNEPPGMWEETNRSVERPPSRFRACRAGQAAGQDEDRASLREARVQSEVFPIHQRWEPSVIRRDRTAGLPRSRPLTILPPSISNGPACMSSRAPAKVSAELRRWMESWPPELSAKIPDPSDEVEFQAPKRFPSVTTSPRGFPSGVKKPAFIAASAPYAREASCAESYADPGPSGWSITSNRWLRESKATPSNSMPCIIFRASEGDFAGEEGEGSPAGSDDETDVITVATGFSCTGFSDGAGWHAHSVSAANEITTKLGLRITLI